MTTLEEAGPKVNVAEIVHHGEKLILPSGLKIPDAIELLHRRLQYLEESVAIHETFDTFPWDGAYALAKVLTKRYGWVPSASWVSQTVNVEIGPHEVAKVPWGAFELPNVKGAIKCAVGSKNNRMVFALDAKVLRKDEETVRALFDEVRDYIKHNSIYRGKAIKLRFLDNNGNPLSMPEPKFLDTDDTDLSQLIYSEDIQNAVETNLFTPIARVEDCLANGLTVKRGVLLGGTYGTGKTLAAKAAAKIAVDHGITYIYVPRADELSHAIEFAKQYQSPACVVFCEDIDRVMAGERSVEMDDILNIIDGIDNKTSNIIVVLTTNELEKINPAMLRPGRLDAVIEVTPPDAKAVEKLLRVYGGSAISDDTDLTEVGKTLEGTIPAVITEVVKRAKLAQLRLQERGTPVEQLTELALLETAKSMSSQLRLLKKLSEAPEDAPTIDSILRELMANSPAETSVEKMRHALGI